MPDPIVPPSAPQVNVSIPTPTGPDLFNNVAPATNLPPSGAEYARSISNGESITDLINDVNNLQKQGEDLLGEYKMPQEKNYNLNIDDVFSKISSKINPSEPSLQSFNKPMVLGNESDYNRYKDSKHFQTYGYTPNLGAEQEYKYGRAMDWGETIGKALGGGTQLAADTFVEGWKGWGRMAEALFTWDSSKLMGSPEERYEMAKRQEEIMNKYAIYDTAESKDGIFNRQFFGNMLQQSGFAIGAGLQFASEELLTAGIGGFVSGASKGIMLGRVAKGLERTAEVTEKATDLFKPAVTQTVSELANDTRKVMNTVTHQPNVLQSFTKGLKNLVPGYGTIEELTKLHKAGAGFAQLAFTGVGGVRRGLSEFNMARSESIFEAAGTYKGLKDRLVQEYVDKNGAVPTGDDLEKINQKAEDASHDNFWTNMGVLSVMNRIQFDNMFKSFSKSRSLLGEGAAELEGKAFQVSGKVEGKTVNKVYEKGLFSIGKIAKDFGKKEAAWQATKSIGKGLMKFEGTEGIQELLQTGSDVGLQDYYYDLYHGKKGYGSKMDAVLSNVQNPFTNTEGMKTFLMGALTGRLIAPLSGGITKISEGIQERNEAKKSAEKARVLKQKMIDDYTTKNGKAPEGEALTKIENFVKESTDYKTVKQKVKESVGLMNALYQDPKWFQREALANIKVNNKAAETMEQAAANQDKYVFNNSKDSALAKTIAAAIKLDMYDSLRDVIKEYGADMNNAEFKEAFGIEATPENKKNVKDLTSKVVSNIEDYYQTFKNLKDKYGDRIIPELYKNNKPEVYKNAQLQKAVLDNVIEMIATNSFKAKQVIKRASELQSEMSSHPTIGSSSAQILTAIGSDMGLDRHIDLLEQEIKVLASAENMTKEQKESLKSKIEELKHIKDWKESKEELINEAKVDKSYRAYAALINIFNKRAGIETAVSKLDIEDNFLKFTDYIKLNNDHKEYVDAMNLLTDPKNMDFVVDAHVSGQLALMRRMFDDHLAELEDETGVKTEELSKYNISQEEDGTWTITDPDGVEVEKGIATEEEAKAKADELSKKKEEELIKIEKETKEETPSDIEAKKAELQKELEKLIADQEERLKKLTLGTPIGGKYDLKIGDRFDDDVIDASVDVANNQLDQNFNPSIAENDGAGYSVVSRIYQYGEMENGKVSKRPSIEITTFNTKAEADAFIEQKKIKNAENKAKLGSNKQIDAIKEQLAALEGKKSKSKLEEVLDKISKPKTKEEFDKVSLEVADILDNAKEEDFTEEEINKILKALDDKEEEINKLASRPPSKVISDTDPQFVNEYNGVLKQISDIVNKKDVTALEAKNAFKLLTPVLAKLSPEKRKEYNAKHLEERNKIVEVLEKKEASQNIDGTKQMTTKMLSSDDVPLNTIVDTLFHNLNIVLDPKFKQDVLAHFETEYLKAIDRKIAKLRSQSNTGTTNPVIQNLTKVANEFRTKVQKNLEAFEVKSQELADKKADISLNVDVDTNFENFVHKSIKEGKDGSATPGQKVAIENFIKSGLLSSEDIERYDLTTKYGASEIINLGVARMLTLQINKAAIKHFEKNDSKDLKELLKKYLPDALDMKLKTKEEREELEDIVDGFLDKDSYASLDELLSVLRIPKTQELTDEQYKIINQYRNSINTIMEDSYILSVIDSFEQKQAQLVSENIPVSSQEIITDDLVKQLGKYLTKSDDYKAGLENFKADLIEAFEKLKNQTVTAEALKIISAVASKHIDAKKMNDGKKLVQSILNYALQTDNILNSGDVNSELLSEDQIKSILDNPTDSLTKDQIAQVEEYAKTKGLEENKKKLQAAAGYQTAEPVTYSPARKAIETISLKFNSMRPKMATDLRTKEDITTYLTPDEYGRVNTKQALAYVMYSPNATESEKELAKMLFALAQDEDVILVDNDMESAGAFDPETNIAVINLEAAGYKINAPSVPVETVILHELLHAAIEKAIADPASKYGKRIRDVFNAVKGKEGASTFYAFQDSLEPDEQLREFVTEAFTNPAFQYMLAKIPYANTSETIWDRFLKVISDLLRAFGVDVSDTALSEVLSLTDNLLNKRDIVKTEEDLSVEKVMDDIKNAATEEELNKILDQLQIDKEKYNKDLFNALQASIRRKLQSINAVNIKEALKTYTPIKIKGTTYYYKIENGRVSVVKKANYKLSNVKKAEVLSEVAKQVLSKTSIVNLLSENELDIIKSLGGNREEMGSYASGSMPDDLETIGETKYPNALGTTLSIPFKNIKVYNKFKRDFKRYKTGKITWGELTDMYNKTAVRDFAEIYNYLEASGKSRFANIDMLIRKGYITLESIKASSKTGGFTDLTYGGKLTSEELIDMYKDIINGVNINDTEYNEIKSYINKTLSAVFGYKISDELQKKLEGEIFASQFETTDLPEDFNIDNPPAFTITSDLSDAKYQEDLNNLDITTVDPSLSISAVEPNGLRSASFVDGRVVNGEFVEHPFFVKYYNKVRSIINNLSLLPSEKLEDLHVTLHKDVAELRWDGSAEDEDWKKAEKAVIGYISDENGNPIVFNKKGEKVGTLDRNNLSDKKGLDNGENQIVYFTTMNRNTSQYTLSKMEQSSLQKLFAARDAVMAGKPQIAKLQKVSQGQMNLKSLVKKGVVGQKNTLRDADLRDGLNSDHVTMQPGKKNGQVEAVITGADGATNTTVLFTPSSRAVKISTPDGEFTLFDHLFELMKLYHELDSQGYSRIGDIQSKLVNFAYNIWLTGDRYGLKIPQDFRSISIKVKDSNGVDVLRKLPLFETKDGITVVNEENLKAARTYINNLKVNVYKNWLNGKEKFNFPYISEVGGKKMINFEEKSFREFLVNDIGLLSYITEVPSQEDIKRYNSAVHFSAPVDLNVANTGINVTEDNVLNNINAVKQEVKKAIDNTTPSTNSKAKPTPKRKFKAPSYQEIYEKICK